MRLYDSKYRLVTNGRAWRIQVRRRTIFGREKWDRWYCGYGECGSPVPYFWVDRDEAVKVLSDLRRAECGDMPDEWVIDEKTYFNGRCVGT